MHIKIELAKSYLEAGLSVLPAKRREKRPAVGAWKPWTERLPTEVEVEAWFANRHDGVCLVTGRVSGNLECIDFDNGAELYGAWKGRVDPSVLGRCVVERSQSGGIHVYYRCEGAVDGNRKLARGMRDGAPKTLVETRGEGGVVMCAPTEGYEILSGAFACLPTLSGVEREGLLAAACALDELPAAEVSSRASDGRVGADSGFLARPGDDFADRGDPRPYLLAAGWQFCGTAPDGNEQWTRPGKDVKDGLSATLKDKVFYVFSSNAAPFEPGKGYNAFQVYTLLEHRGDFTAAASALLDKGYGKRDNPLDYVDLSNFNPQVGVSSSGSEKKGACGELTREGDSARPISIAELVAAHPKMRPPIIDGFLRLGETMNLIAPPKTGKSWLVNDLAVSVAMGTDWLGFTCTAGKVLIIDNELHKETTADRVPRTIEARGFDIKKVGERLFIENQRGHLKSIDQLDERKAEFREAGYKLIIIDAFYRALPVDTDENSNSSMTQVYNKLDRFAEDVGCAVVLVHHTSKGNQAYKSTTDSGSGAGAISRAADTHVILRKHRKENAAVLDSVVRSWKGIGKIGLRFEYPLWRRDDALDLEDIDGVMLRKDAKVEVPENDLVAKLVRLVDSEKPMPKTAFIDWAIKRLSADVGGKVAKKDVVVAFSLAEGYGYLVCERAKHAKKGSQATKFVQLGEVPLPQAENDAEGDENEEEENYD